MAQTYDRPLDDWLSSAARQRPAHPAVQAPAGTLTYAELHAEASAYARRLAALGVRRGDRVSTTLAPGLVFVALVHAVPRLGAALVPLNTRLTEAELSDQERLAGARLTVREPLEGPQADVPLLEELDPAAVNTVLFTSGTTSQPKTVELTLANHAASAAASTANLGSYEHDRWLCALPLFHVGGLAILLRSAINATTVVLHDGFDAQRVKHELESGGVTLASLVSTMLHRLRDAGLGSAPSLRALLLGGGPIPAALLDWARDSELAVVPTYGMTETASQVVTVAPADALRGVRAGRPLKGVELRVDRDGEILVRGPMVAAGSLAPDGWLHTGDLGSLDEEGRLRVEGRRADLIVTGGENVMAGEVEEALRSHPAVVDAAVVGVDDEEWGERLIAVVVRERDATQEELIAHCRERLTAYKAPKEIRFVDVLPRNAAGKLLRPKLRGVFAAAGPPM